MYNAFLDSKHKIILFIFIFVCFLFFIHKPLFIDEPLFVGIGEKIPDKGLEFYNFYGNAKDGLTEQKTQNPPFANYLIAIASLISKSIVFYRLIFIIPAILLILGIYEICRITDLNKEDSFYCSLFSIASPVFMINFLYITSDVLMTMFYTWAVYFWIKGEKVKQYRNYFISSILICLSFFTKYYGITLVPLLFVFSIYKNKKLKKHLFILIIPILFVILFEIFTFHLYGIGLVSKAISYPYNFDKDWRRLLIGLSFFGGCYLWIILEWRLISYLIAASLIYLIPINDIFYVELSLWCKLQMIFLISIGISGFALLLKYLREKENYNDPYFILFVLWILGTWIFSTFINWSVNARTMLPMLAPTIILLYKFSIRFQKPGRKKLAFVLFFLISFLIQCADYEFALGQKQVVEKIAKMYNLQHYNFCTQGEFGFSRIAKNILNAAPVNFKHQPVFNEKLIMIIPKNNCNILWPVPKDHYNIKRIEHKIKLPIGIMNRYTGAGIHHYKWGPLPFAIGKQPPNEYFIYTSRLYFK
jgi:hypothetical protein